METSDESTNKVKRIDDTMERPPQPRPIPSVLHRNASAVDPKPAPTFTWPLSTAKPSPSPSLRPSSPRPVGAKIAMPAVVRSTTAAASAPVRAPRGTDAPPPRVDAKPIAPMIAAVAPQPTPRVEVKPVIEIPAPVAPQATPRFEAKPVIEIPAPVPMPMPMATPMAMPTPMATPMPARVPATIAAEQPVATPATFGSSMLQARTRRAKPSVARDELSNLAPATTFGAGVLQARASGGKKLVIAFVVAVATIAGLCVAMRGGSNHASAPATTQQP